MQISCLFVVVLAMLPKAWYMEWNDKLDFIKIQNFSSKDTVKSMKPHATDQEKYVWSHICWGTYIQNI